MNARRIVCARYTFLCPPRRVRCVALLKPHDVFDTRAHPHALLNTHAHHKARSTWRWTRLYRVQAGTLVQTLFDRPRTNTGTTRRNHAVYTHHRVHRHVWLTYDVRSLDCMHAVNLAAGKQRRISSTIAGCTSSCELIDYWNF